MNDEDINKLCFILVHKIQLNIAEREMSNKNEMIFLYGVEREKTYINYVHELQHALRLCGLTDLADNFKV